MLAWIHCRKVIDRKYTVEIFDLYIPQEEARSDPKSAILTERSIHKAIKNLPLHTKQKIFDCLRKKNVLFHGSDRETSSCRWFMKCVELLFGWSGTPRRYLAIMAVQSTSRRRTRKQAIAHAAAPPSNAPAPASFLSPYSQLPAEPPEDPFQWQDMIDSAPTPSPPQKYSPPPEAPEEDFLPLDFINSPPPPLRHTHSAPPPHPPSNHGGNGMRKFVTVGSVVGICSVFALLLLCCLKKSSKNGDRYKDERPLLTLASNDFSTGIYDSVGFYFYLKVLLKIPWHVFNIILTLQVHHRNLLV